MSSIQGRHHTLAETVVESSLDGLAVMDRESRYTLWNGAMERFAGKTAAEVLGRSAFDVFPFLREHGLDRAVERVLAGETVATEGVVHVNPGGTRKVYDRLYLPLRSARAPGGSIAGGLYRRLGLSGSPGDPRDRGTANTGRRRRTR